jgi:hypothetical protein
MVRLQAPVSILLFTRHFEVAIPVAERQAASLDYAQQNRPGATI